jgi:hypothetical protein
MAIIQILIAIVLTRFWLSLNTEMWQVTQTQIVRLFCIGKGYHRCGRQRFVGFFDALAINAVVWVGMPLLATGFILNKSHLL